MNFFLCKYSFSLDTFLIHRVLKKINILFIVHFCNGKYSFSLDNSENTSRILRKLKFYSVFIVCVYVYVRLREYECMSAYVCVRVRVCLDSLMFVSCFFFK